jgi:hypothetical protein
MPLNRQAKFNKPGCEWVDCGDVTIVGAARHLMEYHNRNGFDQVVVLVRDSEEPETEHECHMKQVVTYECTNPRGDTDKLLP